jgi:hypothetical protein
VKNYPSAHNHVAIGIVEEETPVYLRLVCRTYHFGSFVGGKKGVVQGEKCRRLIPWSRIEVIHELPSGTDWDVEAGFNERGDCVLLNEAETFITRVWADDNES